MASVSHSPPPTLVEGHLVSLYGLASRPYRFVSMPRSPLPRSDAAHLILSDALSSRLVNARKLPEDCNVRLMQNYFGKHLFPNAGKTASFVRFAGVDDSLNQQVTLLNTGEAAPDSQRAYIMDEGANGEHSLNGVQANNGSLAGYGEDEDEIGDEQDVAGADNEEEEGRGSRRRAWDSAWVGSGQESYGEVSKILESRAVEGSMFYLIGWKDGHEPSWLPATSIAKDVLSEYESPWWKAVRSADEQKLIELLEDEGRDVDTVDENGRTALLFVAGLGSEKCVRLLVEAGADVNCQDLEGFTPLHIAAGYVKQNVVSALLELGADPEIQDSKGRIPLQLAQDLLERTPKANPLQFARRLTLERILKILEDEVFENAEVEQILDQRPKEGGGVEYLVKWRDGSSEEWLAAENIGEDLVQDYEAGLEYGIAEKILDKREESGQVEYLVKWADIDKPTWEPFENVAIEVVAEYENVPAQEIEKRQQKNAET